MADPTQTCKTCGRPLDKSGQCELTDAEHREDIAELQAELAIEAAEHFPDGFEQWVKPHADPAPRGATR